MADVDGTQADAGNICQTNCEQVPAKIATGKANSVEYDDVARVANGCNQLGVFPFHRFPDVPPALAPALASTPGAVAVTAYTIPSCPCSHCSH